MDEIKLWHGDCLELMGKIPDQSIDMILSDPPYSTTACKWDVLIPFEPLWSHYRRVIKPRGAIVLTGSQPFTSLLVMSNPEWFRCEWVWFKTAGGGFLNANRYPLKRHESVLVFAPSQPQYNPQKTTGKPYFCRSSSAGGTTFDQSVAGWVTDNDGSRFPTSELRFASDTGLHPTQKPVALFEYLIRTYTNEGETVLDNCSGSGTTGVAAIRCGRRAILIEKEREYYDIAVKRIAEEHAKTALFNHAFSGKQTTHNEARLF